MSARSMAARRRRMRFRTGAEGETFFDTTTAAAGGVARIFTLPKRKRPERITRAFIPRAPRRSLLESILDGEALAALPTTPQKHATTRSRTGANEKSVCCLALPLFRLVSPFHTWLVSFWRRGVSPRSESNDLLSSSCCTYLPCRYKGAASEQHQKSTTEHTQVTHSLLTCRGIFRKIASISPRV